MSVHGDLLEEDLLAALYCDLQRNAETAPRAAKLPFLAARLAADF
jgi:hypothetical protein